MISHGRTLSLFVTVLLSCLPAIAQTSSTQAAKPGTISGRVVNESGRPLPNATVSLRRVGSQDLQNSFTTTDREGKFEVSGLQPVSYQIFVLLRGYAPQIRDLDDPQAGIYRAGDSVTLVLSKGGVITGTVTNQTGDPVVGVIVRAQMVGLADLTDDRGIYRIYGLPEGSYVVWAGGGGESRFTMEVDPFDSDVSTYAPASTRDTAQEIVVHAGAETSNVDIQYRGGPGHSVSGSASGAKGDQSLQFGINLVSVNGPPWEARTFQELNDRGFSINGVDDGDYFVVAMSQRQGEFMFSAAKQITVRGADLSGVELVVEPLSSITGRVVLQELKTTDCPDKSRPVLTETLVSAQSNGFDTFQRALGFLSPTANADERGNVSLKNLPAGRYYFTTQFAATDWYLKSLSFASSETESVKAAKPIDPAGTWTTLKPGDRLNGLMITLAQGAASVRGQITLSKGKTIPEKLYVYLVPAEKEMGDDSLRFYGATMTAEGKVTLNNLAPGRYFVLARRATDGSVSPLTRLRSPDEKTYRLRLRREAEAAKSEIELKPCQNLADLKVRVRTD